MVKNTVKGLTITLKEVRRKSKAVFRMREEGV